MNTGFNFITNLPLIIFAICFSVVFILFLAGGIILLRAKGDPEKIRKGRKVLSRTLFAFLFVLVIVLVFYSVSYFLKKGEVFEPHPYDAEFPISPATNFPPSNEFIKIGDYNFNGPWKLKDNESIERSAVYAIMCQKNDGYDILYIGDVAMYYYFQNNSQNQCWFKNCNNDLYLAVFWAPADNYGSLERKGIKDNIINQINMPCLDAE